MGTIAAATVLQLPGQVEHPTKPPATARKPRLWLRACGSHPSARSRTTIRTAAPPWDGPARRNEARRERYYDDAGQRPAEDEQIG
jgi:hypothetical protein